MDEIMDFLLDQDIRFNMRCGYRGDGHKGNLINAYINDKRNILIEDKTSENKFVDVIVYKEEENGNVSILDKMENVEIGYVGIEDIKNFIKKYK